MDLLIFLAGFLLTLIVFIGMFGVWILMGFEAANYEFEARQRIVWFMVAAFGGPIGATAYLLIRRPRRQAEALERLSCQRPDLKSKIEAAEMSVRDAMFAAGWLPRGSILSDFMELANSTNQRSKHDDEGREEARNE